MVSLVTNRNENSETQGLPPGVFSEMSGFRTENRRHDVGYGVGCPCNRMNSSLKRPPDGNIVFCLILFDETDYEPQTASADARPGLHPATLAAQKIYSLSSPDGNLRTTVTVGEEIRVVLDAGDTPLLAPSPVSMTLEDGEVLGRNARVVRAEKELRRSVDRLALLQEKAGSGSVTTN